MDDELGYDLDAQILAGQYDEVGAMVPRGRAGRQQMARAQPTARVRNAQRMNELQSDNGGGQAFEQITPFTSSNALAVATPTATLIGTPQRRFQLQRLIIDVGRNGTTAATALVTVTQIMIGANPQFTDTGETPVSMYASTAVGVRLFANAARPGIRIVISLAETGLTMTDTITSSGGAIGPVLD